VRKMRKKIALLLVVIALMSMAQECQSGNNKKDLSNPYVGGTEGLQINFQNNRPPEFITDEGRWPFYINVELKNRGERYVAGSDVDVVIRGLQPELFGTTADGIRRNGIAQDVYKVQKIEDRVIDPAEIVVSFGEFKYVKDLQADFGPFDIWSEVCYKYGTDAVALGCILRNPTLPSEEAYCTVNEEKTIYNSGAPIQIKKFVEMPAGRDTVDYIFTIEHVGSGRFFTPGSRCTDMQEGKLFFKIQSDVATFSCQPVGTGGMEGEVYLGDDGMIDIRCTQMFKSETDSPDQIRLEILYDYQIIKKTPFLVKAN
jgi:hypothetical protein